MVVLNSGISWCSGTLNPWVGCRKVSDGCKFCYAEELVQRMPSFGHDFADVKLHMKRLAEIRRMKPHVHPDDTRTPYLAFVNSMSDFFFEDVPDENIHTALDAFEAAPQTIFQVLTKRPIRARKVLVGRYGNGGIPPNVWMGVSAEDNRVAKRLDILRSIKDRTGGGGTFFVSVEPIVGPTDKLDFSGLSWVITGGESGPNARTMEREWLMPAIHRAQWHRAALWHKQNGNVASHPNIGEVPDRITQSSDKFRWLRDHGFEVLPQEKGGATVDKQTYREMPAHYHELTTWLNGGSLL
jgi:protein gp37